MPIENISAKCAKFTLDTDGKTQLPVNGEDGKPLYDLITAPFDFGADLDAAIAAFGPEAVMFCFRKGAIQELQSFYRAEYKSGKSVEEIIESVKTWKPTAKILRVSKQAVNPLNAVINQWPTLTDEQREAFLNQLQNMNQ
jgi:hypothetical protein